MNSPAPVPRPPVRWSTHAQVIGFIVTACVGGTLFGLAFALWPQAFYERVVGIVILAAVVALIGWVVGYLRRPIAR